MCDIDLPRRTYYTISRNTEYVWLACSKMSSIRQKCHRRFYYYIHFLISEYISHDWRSTITHVNHKIVLFTQLFFLYFKISIYIISQISTIRKKIRAYQLKLYATTCFQILIWITLSYFFGYVPGLYFVSSSMWKFYTYFEDRKV